ncbi:ACP synthase [Halobacteriales archaeon QS_1_68_44]|nr:MAG: ACP synthase [Halobacteriales archaeon QS_1_68_44]
MSRGILAVGAYAPRNRVTAEAFEAAWGRFEAAGIERKAVPDADEDALTMGAEAARRALSAGGVDGAALSSVSLASTTPPLSEEDLTARLGSYLGAPSRTTRRTYGGHTRAGLDALLDAVDRDGLALVVAADCPRGEPDDAREHAAGAGAAALLVGDDAPATVADSASAADPHPGTRFRRRGSDRLEGLDAGRYDRAAFVEPITAAVDRVDADGFDAVALQAPDGKLPYRTGLDGEAIAAVETVSELGDTGAASVPLGVARAFESGYDRTLAVAWGSGAGATAVRIEGTAPVDASLSAATELDYPAYLRRRGEVVGEKPDGGAAHVPVPTYCRSLPQRHRHEAGRCPECDAVAFPPEGACPDCRELVEFEVVEPAREGVVEAATTIGQGGAPPEFAEQQAKQGGFGVAIARFEAGDGAVSLPIQVIGEAAVGDRVTAVPRRIYVEEGVPRYGLKARPATQ